MTILYPLFFKSIYKDYLWGGNRILKEFSREHSPGIYAESWELSDRMDGMSIITNGPFKGKTLHEITHSHSKSLFGNQNHFDHFPLLLKLIDANDHLSIQVHPDDHCAQIYGGEAKTEAWYIIDATEDAVIYAGFNKHYTKKEINQTLPTSNIISMMHTIPVENGDVIFIPGGRLHAIGKGCLVLEIQQNSNTTYRVYDWDRIDSNGSPRPLHLERAKQVIHYDDINDPRSFPRLLKETPLFKQWNLLSESHVAIEKWVIQDSMEWKKQDQFDILFFKSGKGTIRWTKGMHPVKKGMTCLIPATITSLTLELEEELELLRFYIPQPLNCKGKWP